MQKLIKNRNLYRLLEFVSVLVLFFVITGIFFFKTFSTQGMVVGHDWMMPVTRLQMEKYIEQPFFTWTYDMNLFGLKNPFSITMPFVLLLKSFLFFNLSGELLSKFIILISFLFSGVSIYYLLRFLRLSIIPSLLGGLILITSPVYFNYTIMGWSFVLLSVGVALPLAIITFIKSVRDRSFFYSLITGLIFAIAIQQSQSIIWFPIVFLALAVDLINTKRDLLFYIRSIFVIILVVLTLHISWWPNLLIYKDPGIVKSDLILDSVSQGMRSRLSLTNLLRGWGSLYNQPYEVSFEFLPLALSFILPALSILGIIFHKKNDQENYYSFLLIPIIVLILFLADPVQISKIPLSNLIRDVGRFTALSTLVLTILSAFFLDFLIRNRNPKSIYILSGIVLLLAINAWPFYSGELYTGPKREYDVRLRNYKFPSEYIDIENFLSTASGFTKTYYPPSGTNIGVLSNPDLNGDFREIKDPFRGYSRFPGTVYMHYSSFGKPGPEGQVVDKLFDYPTRESMLKLAGLLNIGKFIIREDIYYPKNQKTNIEALKKTGTVSKSNDLVTIVENPFTVPLIFSPKILFYSSGDMNLLRDLFEINSQITNEIGIIFNQEIKNFVIQNGIYGGEINNNAKIVRIMDSTEGLYDVYYKGDHTHSLTFKQNNNRSLNLPFRSNSNTFGWSKIGKVALKSGEVEISLNKSSIAKSNQIEKIILYKGPVSKEYADSPKVAFERINPTKYIIRVSGAKKDFAINFSDSFHSGWRIYPKNNDLSGAENRIGYSLTDDLHFQSNGFGNLWIIKSDQYTDNNNMEFVLEFKPQRNFEQGQFVQAAALSVYLLLILFLWNK